MQCRHAIRSIAAIAALLSESRELRATQSSFALAHITVIDVTDGTVHADQTVAVDHGRIIALGPAATVRSTVERTIDATGKFLIPGLWDMHVHALWNPAIMQSFGPLLVANGVTGARDMGSPVAMEEQDRWRRDMLDNRRLGPRLVIAGKIVDGPKPIWPGSLAVGTESEGRAAVHTLKAGGADFVKVYSLLPRAAYFAIADEARRAGLSFVGHVPLTVSTGEAADAGQRSIEHLSGFLDAASTRAGELPPDFRPWSATSLALLAGQSDSKARALMSGLHERGTWQCPTLVTIWTVFRNLARGEVPDDRNEKYLPLSQREEWRRMAEGMKLELSREEREGLDAYVARHVDFVTLAHQSGVPLLAGSDVPKPHLVPGFSLHDELALFVRAGLTPVEALQTATINPARFLGLEQDGGTIAVGKRADLVVLEADPLVDIAATRRIHAVIVNGRMLDRAALDKVLAELEAVASTR
jgi:hypothetical protein